MALRAGYYGVKRFLRDKLETIAMTYDDTIKSLFPRSEQAVLGAKNLFDLSILKPKSGATLTLNDTGFKCEVETVTTWCGVEYTKKLPVNTKFKVSCNYAITSGIVYANAAGSTDGTNYTAISNTGVITSGSGLVEFEFDTLNYSYIRITFFVTNESVTTADVTFTNVMLKLTTDMDDIYAPYTMTNKELTDTVILVPLELTAGTNVDFNNNNKSVIIGNLKIIRTQIHISEELAANSQLLSAGIEYSGFGGAVMVNTNTGATYGILVSASNNKLAMTTKTTIPTGYYVLDYCYV